jgi:hypothetical protein
MRPSAASVWGLNLLVYAALTIHNAYLYITQNEHASHAHLLPRTASPPYTSAYTHTHTHTYIHTHTHTHTHTHMRRPPGAARATLSLCQRRLRCVCVCVCVCLCTCSSAASLQFSGDLQRNHDNAPIIRCLQIIKIDTWNIFSYIFFNSSSVFLGEGFSQGHKGSGSHRSFSVVNWVLS